MYTVDVCNGGTLSATLTLDASTIEDCNLVFFDENEVELGKDKLRNGEDVGSLSVGVTGDTSYYIRVVGRDAGIEVFYNLDISLTC